MLCVSHFPCVDGSLAEAIIVWAGRVGDFQVDTLHMDHRADHGVVNAQVQAWAHSQRANPGAIILYVDVSPPLPVAAFLLSEWGAGSVVRVHVADHHDSAKADVAHFRDAVAAMGPGVDSRLAVTWGEGTGTAGCTLAERWARAHGCLVDGINATVLEEVAFTDTTGEATLATRAFKSDEWIKPAWETILRCSAAELEGFRAQGAALLATLSTRMAPLVAQIAVAAPEFSPPGTTLFIVSHPDARQLNDLADVLWDRLGAKKADGPDAANKNSVLLMHTVDESTSLRNAWWSDVNAKAAAQFLAAAHPMDTPAGGHPRAAGVRLPKAVLVTMFDTATPNAAEKFVKK